MSTIFWDFDGTLVHSRHLWSGSMYAALTAVHPQTDVTLPMIRECNARGGFPWDTADRDQTALIGNAWWHHIEAHTYSVYLSCGEHEEICAVASSLIKHCILSPDRYHLYPDTVAVLRETKQLGHRNVLLSNNYPELALTAKAIGLLPYLDGVITSGLEGYDKPRRELFEIAKRRYPDKDYYMIGDNPNADILGGKRAGMTTISMHTVTPLADHTARTLTDCLSCIGK